MSAERTGSGSKWRLAVTAGPHQGAALDLAPGEWHLGSDDTNDIVLSGQAIASRQISFDIGANGAALTALAPGALLHGRSLDAGRRLTLSPGAELAIGETRLLLLAEGEVARAPAMPRPALLGCLALGFATALALYAWPEVPAGHASASLSPATAMHPAAAPAKAALAARLGAGLDAVNLQDTGRALVATGTIAASAEPAWAAQKTWFDRRYGGRIGLIDQVHVAAPGATPALGIAAVAYEPIPTLVLQNGERYGEGAVLPDGWSVVTIGKSAVILRRGGREIRLAL